VGGVAPTANDNVVIETADPSILVVDTFVAVFSITVIGDMLLRVSNTLNVTHSMQGGGMKDGEGEGWREGGGKRSLWKLQ
jgi:hypothetical protein